MEPSVPDTVLNHLWTSGTMVLPEVVARLFLLVFEHADGWGRHHFGLSPSLMQGPHSPSRTQPGEGEPLEA